MMLKFTLPISKPRAHIRAASPPYNGRTPEIWRSQNQYSNGTQTQSLNNRIHRNIHPAEPKACKMPMETNANKNAFPKQIGSKKTGLERDTAKADSRKGNMVTQSIPTIDTGTRSVLRIKETSVLPADRNAKTPHKNPDSQKHARKKRHPLRHSFDKSRQKNRATE